MRRRQTDAEAAIWRVLRARQVGGAKFRRQHPIGPYVVDFCCWDRRLIVEVDGSQHTESKDLERTSYLKDAGFDVLRFWDNIVLAEPTAVAEAIGLRLGLA